MQSATASDAASVELDLGLVKAAVDCLKEAEVTQQALDQVRLKEVTQQALDQVRLKEVTQEALDQVRMHARGSGCCTMLSCWRV